MADTQCCAELKLMAGARCPGNGSVKRGGEWFCRLHDPGPVLRRVSTWMANTETTTDLGEAATREEDLRNRRWWKA